MPVKIWLTILANESNRQHIHTRDETWVADVSEVFNYKAHNTPAYEFKADNDWHDIW